MRIEYIPNKIDQQIEDINKRIEFEANSCKEVMRRIVRLEKVKLDSQEKERYGLNQRAPIMPNDKAVYLYMQTLANFSKLCKDVINEVQE